MEIVLKIDNMRIFADTTILSTLFYCQIKTVSPSNGIAQLWNWDLRTVEEETLSDADKILILDAAYKRYQSIKDRKDYYEEIPFETKLCFCKNKINCSLSYDLLDSKGKLRADYKELIAINNIEPKMFGIGSSGRKIKHGRLYAETEEQKQKRLQKAKETRLQNKQLKQAELLRKQQIEQSSEDTKDA